MKTERKQRSPSGVTRRLFLRVGLTGALGAVVARRPARAAARGDNPFVYSVDRYRRVDPALIRYERAHAFSCPRPEPRRMAITETDQLFIAADRSVVVMDAQGIPVREISCPAPARCVGVAADGVTYVGFRDRVAVYEAKGTRRAEWDAVGGRPFLTAIAVGEAGVFVADSGNRVIWRYDLSGRVVGEIGRRDREQGVPGFVVPSPYLDVVLAADGLLRVNNPGRHRVETYTTDGQLELSWGKPSAAIEGFSGCCNPVSLAVLQDGRCVTFEKGLPRVKVYHADGTLESVVAGPDAFADVGLEFPSADPDDSSVGGLAGVVDGRDRIYILDRVNGQIQVMRRKLA